MVAEPKVFGRFSFTTLMRRRTFIASAAQSDLRATPRGGKKQESRSSRWRTLRAGMISRIWNLRF
jgi:hypothetical protein